LPFGSTCVTTAAIVVTSASERLIEPLPSLVEVESAVNRRLPTGVPRIGSLDLPKKLSMPESSLLSRLRCVSLAMLA
jgi:hypothetical protein